MNEWIHRLIIHARELDYYHFPVEPNWINWLEGALLVFVLAGLLSIFLINWIYKEGER